MKSNTSTKKQIKENRQRTIFITCAGIGLLAFSQIANTSHDLQMNFLSLISVWVLMYGQLTRFTNY